MPRSCPSSAILHSRYVHGNANGRGTRLRRHVAQIRGAYGARQAEATMSFLASDVVEMPDFYFGELFWSALIEGWAADKLETKFQNELACRYTVVRGERNRDV